MALPSTVAVSPVVRLGDVASTACTHRLPMLLAGSGSSLVGEAVGELGDTVGLALADWEPEADAEDDAEDDGVGLVAAEVDGEGFTLLLGLTAARRLACDVKPTSRIQPANTCDWSLS